MGAENPRRTTGPLGGTSTPRPATGPLPWESAGPKSATGPLPRESTGPLPKTATGPLPRESTGPLPKTATGPLPRAPSKPPEPADLDESFKMRLQVRDLAEAQTRHEDAAEFRRGFAFRRVRPLLAALIVVAGLAAAFVPLLGEWTFARERAHLAEALEAQKADIEGGHPGAATLDDWLSRNDVGALRGFYQEVRPRVGQTLRDAGFAATEANVSLRLDGARLVLGAQFERDDGRPLAWEVPVGAGSAAPARPDAGLGAVVADRILWVLTWVLVGAIGTAALWFAPRRRAT
jgi:hypothetical protein